MDLTLYRDESGFDALAGEWNDLLAASRFPTVFLTREWQTIWWRGLGCQRGSLFLLAARQDGRLVGILPLCGVQEDDYLTLHVIGCVEVSDYLDLIIEAGREEDVYAAFLAWLAGPEAPRWEAVDLCNQPAVSLSHTLLPQMARAAGRGASVLPEDVCPVISLPQPDDPAAEPDGWEAYLALLDKKQRHEIRRKRRRLEREAPDAGFRTVTGGPDLPAAIEDFIALHRLSSPAKHAFMTPQMQDFFRAVATALAGQGWLRLSFLDIGGRPAATYFCMDYRNEILVYNSGYDPSNAPHFSPGWVLLAEEIRQAIASGRARFDFLQGNEDYKYRFGGVDTAVYRTWIFRRPEDAG